MQRGQFGNAIAQVLLRDESDATARVRRAASAAPRLLNERADHMLTTTAVVHWTYLGLVDQSRAAWPDRARLCRR